MARLFVTDINLNKNQLIAARVENLSAAPSAPVKGQIYFNNSLGDNKLYFWDGTEWMPTAASAEVITDVILSTVKGGTALTEVTDDANNTITLNLDNTTVTAGSYGSQTKIPTFTVDAQGRLTAAGEVDVATELDITGDTGSTSISLLSEGLTVSGGEGIDVAVTENTITIAGENASDTNKGIASFNSTAFQVTDGHVNLIGFANNIDANGNKITELADPTADTDAANKRYVDAVAQGLHIHEAAHVATTANLDGVYENGTSGVGATLTLATALTVLDGHTLSVGNRILVKNQTTASQNGIYVYTSDTVLTRALDFDTAPEIHGGDFVFVENGTLYNSTGWVNENEVNTVGTDSVQWLQFSGVGTFTAGAGLGLSGTEFNIGSVVGGGITVNADSIQIDASIVARKYTSLIGDGSATSISVTHNLGNQYVNVQVFEVATNALVEADVTLSTTNTVTIGFSVAPTQDQYRVIIVGQEEFKW